MSSKPNSLSELFYPNESFLQHSNVLFYKCSLQENFPVAKISPNVERTLGYKPEQFYENKTFWISKIHPEDRSEINNIFRDIINLKNSTYVYRFKHGDGYYIWLRDENIVTFDDKQKPQAIAGTAIDITRQKKAEQQVRNLNETLEQRIDQRTKNLTIANRKLKKQMQQQNKAEQKITEQQRRLKLLQLGINYINDMVVITKAPVDDLLNASIIFTNKAFEHITGYRSSEVYNRSPSFLHGKKTQPAKIKKLNNSIKNNEHVRVEFINYKKDDTPYWVELEMAPLPTEEDGMQYWIGINRDISQRKKAEKTLEENEERYRTYAELSFDAIFEIDLQGNIIDCNSRACQLFGYDRKELLSKNVKDLTPEQYKSSIPEELSSTITTGSRVVQRAYIKKNGETFISEINTKLYQRSEEDHIIAYVRDISEQIQYEQTIEKSLREKSTLLAEVHHRVKNNLAVISGLLEMQTFNAENEQIQNELKESQSRIKSIATVHELLYQSESFSDISLEPYIDELVNYIAGAFAHDSADIHFENNIAPLSLTVHQAVPCGLLLNELITNAYKHAFPDSAGGTIYITLKNKDDLICLSVEDDGVGLPDDFDIEKSSSLGMTIIQTLVTQLNGTLTVEKTPFTKMSISFEREN